MKKCRICGCTDIDCLQCIKAQGHPCHWIKDDLCSRCFDEIFNQQVLRYCPKCGIHPCDCENLFDEEKAG